MRLIYPRFISWLEGLLSREDGQDMLEYAMVIAVIIAVVVDSIRTVAVPINTILNNVIAAF